MSNKTLKYEYYRKTKVVGHDEFNKPIRLVGRGLTESEAQYNLIEQCIEYKNGNHKYYKALTVENWCDKWVTTYKKSHIQKAGYQQYINCIDNHIKSSIGTMQLSQVKTMHLQEIMNKQQGYSKSHINFIRNTLKALFEMAIANELIVKNPAKNLKIPIHTEGTKRSLTLDERNAFFTACNNHHRGTMFKLMLACGLRPQEVRALSWSDIKGNRLIINSAMETKSNTVKAPKSSAGNRIIPIPNWYLSELNKIPKKHKLVFPSMTGKHIDETCFFRAWCSLKRLMDIELGATLYRNQVIESVIDSAISPYFLRHTYCTDLCIAGVDIRTAMTFMGHANINITSKIYTHIEKTMIDKAAAQINVYKPNIVRSNVLKKRYHLASRS